MITEEICSFCFKPRSDVKVLIKAPNKLVYICDKCVADVKKIIKEIRGD